MCRLFLAIQIKSKILPQVIKTEATEIRKRLERATRTYVGATRSVVYANFSQQGNQLSIYWNKQNGVIVEAYITPGSMAATV